MSKIIVYQRADGEITIVYPVVNINEDPSIFTEAVVIERAIKRCVPLDLQKSVCIVEKSSLPEDRTFRNAWELIGTDVKVKMEKARKIHKDRMNDVVRAKMTKLDEDYMRADEKNDAKEKKKISEKKQALRDVSKHPEIEAAKTPEELKAVWPEVLNG